MRRPVSGNEVSLPHDQYPLIRSRSLDEVRQFYSSTSTPTRIEVPGREQFECRLNYAAVGPVSISTIWSRGTVIGVAEAPLSSYFLSFARAGFSEHVQGDRSAAAVVNQSGVCASSASAPTARLEAGHGRVRKGPCNFTASGGGAGVSGSTISFYSTKGAYWGTLSGTGAIVGGFSIEGQLDLVWQGWK